MTANDVVQLIAVKELPGDIRAKLAADAPFTWRSAKHGLGIGPQQLTHDSLLRRLPAAFRGAGFESLEGGSLPVLCQRQERANPRRKLVGGLPPQPRYLQGIEMGEDMK